ncbi:hypothetical protein GCM10027605_37720 [Micromonospora zhanjiangensis]
MPSRTAEKITRGAAGEWTRVGAEVIRPRVPHASSRVAAEPFTLTITESNYIKLVDRSGPEPTAREDRPPLASLQRTTAAFGILDLRLSPHMPPPGGYTM